MNGRILLEDILPDYDYPPELVSLAGKGHEVLYAAAGSLRQTVHQLQESSLVVVFHALEGRPEQCELVYFFPVTMYVGGSLPEGGVANVLVLFLPFGY